MPTLGATVLIGLLLVCGMFAGLLASRLRFPRVVAYVLVGVLFSEALLGGILNLQPKTSTATLTTIALGVIAYIIGGSMTVPQLRRMGKVMLGAALAEAAGAVVLVFVCVWTALQFWGDGMPEGLAFAFAAVAATTAPATTVAIMHQYHAQGPLSTILLGVVALDDAIGIVVFSLLVALAGGGGALTESTLWIHGFSDIVLALALGVAGGRILACFSGHVRQAELRLPLLIGGIVLVVGLSESFGFSPLLSSIALGFSARHFLGAAGDRVLVPVEFLEELVFVLFFGLAGAHFDAAVITDHFWLVLVYLIARVVGKIGGAAVGARAVGAPPVVANWLGFGLVPQAGVAVGLALSLERYPGFTEAVPIVVNVVLGTTLLYEVIGPLATRFALTRAGELGERRPGGGLR